MEVPLAGSDVSIVGLISLIVALVALFIAIASACWSVKNYRARIRSELPEVRVWIPQLSKPSQDQKTPLSVQIHNPPLHSSWQIIGVEVVDAPDRIDCLKLGDTSKNEWRNYVEFGRQSYPNEKRTLWVRPETGYLMLTFLFTSPRRSYLRAAWLWVSCGLLRTWLRRVLFWLTCGSNGTKLWRLWLRKGVAQEQRWSDVIRVSLKSLEEDGGSTKGS